MEGSTRDKFVMAAPRPRTPSEQQYSDRKLRSRAAESRDLGINPKAVLKWRTRATVWEQDKSRACCGSVVGSPPRVRGTV